MEGNRFAIYRCMDTIKFCNFVIPKDTLALVSLYSLHMDENYWRDPFVFRPERFLDEYGAFIHHENFMPFGSGNISPHINRPNMSPKI